MSAPDRELAPLYESPRKGTLLGYNLWTAHKSSKHMAKITSGGRDSKNIWALSSAVNGSRFLSHWNSTTGEWTEYSNFCDDTKCSLKFKSIYAGPNKELWAIGEEDSFLYRHIPEYNEMKKGIYLAKWERIETGDRLFTTISIGSHENIWAISFDPHSDMQKTVLFHLDIKLKDDTSIKETTIIPGRLKDAARYEWKKLVVDKKLCKIDCNANGEIWGIDCTGKLYHRVKKHANEDPSALDAYEPEESTGPNENFFLLPGEDMDTAVWRLVNPFKFSIIEEHDTIVTSVAVGARSVWCLDNEGKLYLRTGTNFFRRITESDEAEIYMNRLKEEKTSLNASIDSGTFWRQVSKLRHPHVVKPNPMNLAFKGKEKVPDFQRLLVTSIDVTSDDVLNAVSISGSYWFRFRPQKLTIITANAYKKIWDDRGTGVEEDIGIWRAQALSGYHTLGDFAERSHLSFPLTHNFESPNSVVISASEAEEQYLELGPEDSGFGQILRLLAKPATYKRIWDDRNFTGRSKIGMVTLWNPIAPSTEYASLGCVATPANNLKEGSVPQGELAFCVHKSVLLSGMAHRAHGKFSNQSLWCTEKQTNGKAGNEVSIWEVQGIRNEGTSAGGFLALDSFPHKRTNDVLLYVLNIARSSSSWD